MNTCRLQSIFQKQQGLIDRYHGIEVINGLVLCHESPVDLSDRFGQAKLRDYAWRMTEELTEASWSLDKKLGWTDFCEELVDALHFLVELCIHAGITPDDLHNGSEHIDRLEGLYSMAFSHYYQWGEANGYEVNAPPPMTGNIDHQFVEAKIYRVIHFLGGAINLLKNKAWKQSHRETNRQEFVLKIQRTFVEYIDLVGTIGLSPQQVFNHYVHKNEVNKVRQVSGY